MNMEYFMQIKVVLRKQHCSLGLLNYFILQVQNVIKGALRTQTVLTLLYQKIILMLEFVPCTDKGAQLHQPKTKILICGNHLQRLLYQQANLIACIFRDSDLKNILELRRCVNQSPTMNVTNMQVYATFVYGQYSIKWVQENVQLLYLGKLFIINMGLVFRINGGATIIAFLNNGASSTLGQKAMANAICMSIIANW